MATDVTSLKVPVHLRDRLREFSRSCDMTMTATLECLLRDAEDRAFWAQVKQANDAMGPEDRSESAWFAESNARLMAENLANNP